MSILKKLSKTFGREADKTSGDLGDMGVKVMHDRTLATRIILLGKVQAQLETLRTVEEKVEMLAQLVRLVGAPWGRAGDRMMSGKILLAWEQILQDWQGLYAPLRSDPEIAGVIMRQDALNSHVDWWGTKEVMPYGWMVLEMLFLTIDVEPQKIAVIVSQVTKPPRRGGEDDRSVLPEEDLLSKENKGGN